MNAGRLIGRVSAADRGGVLILAGSAALHFVVLTLIGLDLVARTDVSVIPDRPIELDLEPWPLLALPARPGRSQSVASDVAAPAPSSPLPSLPRLRRPPALLPETPALPAAPAAGAAPAPETGAPAIPAVPTARSRVDAVGASITLPDAWRGDACRNPTDFAAWQAAGCAQRSPPARAEIGKDAAALEAAVGQRRGTAAERRRDDGFARTAQANEAWRAYIRNEGDYPGLRSLFTQH